MKEVIEEIAFKAVQKKSEFIENTLREIIKKEFGILIKTREEADDFFKKNPDVVLEQHPSFWDTRGNLTERFVFRCGNKIYSDINIYFNYLGMR